MYRGYEVADYRGLKFNKKTGIYEDQNGNEYRHIDGLMVYPASQHEEL